MTHYRLGKAANILFMIILLTILYLSSLYNYLLFHSIAEIFSVCIAFTVFLLAWNSSEYIEGNYLSLIGIAYLFIGFLDLLHTLSYKGMHIFTDYNYYANQLWIATRYIESLTLMVAFMLADKKKPTNNYVIFVIYAIVTTSTVLSVFVWKVFPTCFVAGVGLTPFKKISEYVISSILVLAIFFLQKHKRIFDQQVYKYLLWSMIFTIGSELAFTFYIDNYGFSNLIGHYFKIFSFYLIYKAIINKGVREPYEVIFRELKANELKLCQQNDQLRNQAIIDGLTGLFNHRYLYETLEKEIKRCNQCRLTVILMDIDFFKKVNDQYGHIVGDEILAQLAQVIKNNIRHTDVAGRYGGEEFLLILPETTLEQGYKIAEKLRLKIQAESFTQDIKITVSAGVAQYTTGEVSQLVHLADQKLYKAKHSGRNRVQL